MKSYSQKIVCLHSCAYLSCFPNEFCTNPGRAGEKMKARSFRMGRIWGLRVQFQAKNRQFFQPITDAGSEPPNLYRESFSMPHYGSYTSCMLSQLTIQD